MCVSMVRVRVVLVIVHEFLVQVLVAVSSAGRDAFVMCVGVMGVFVRMFMAVGHRLVAMRMGVAFAEMQPYA